MEPIKILPHHASHYFDVFYLGWTPENVVRWYENAVFKQHGIATMRKVINNLSQLISIVTNKDEDCRMCPRNEFGENPGNPKNFGCYMFDSSSVDFAKRDEIELAKFLGIAELLDEKPVQSKYFFQLMRPLYEQLIPDLRSRKTNRFHIRDRFSPILI
ncbi:MAG: hypothetical protein Q8N99_00740 [Nanoarchaeota archaeon]|nr:hypothetical protein [Nanoarchaeota archaeon]